jgi:hypothetical protein
MKLYIITHKPFANPAKDAIYQPLLVGADFNKGDGTYQKDNDFDGNISSKNKSFCELTGMYWIWKRSKEDIVGLCHYRRYFCKTERFFQKATILKGRDIEQALKHYDMILPERGKNEYNGHTAKDFFDQQHDPKVWQDCRELIDALCPEYASDFAWFETEEIGYCYNMCIMKKELFDDYSEWLFGILFALEDRVDLTQYSDYNVRMFGFVAERLINVWVHHHGLTVKEMPVYLPEGPSIWQRAVRKLKKYKKKIRV